MNLFLIIGLFLLGLLSVSIVSFLYGRKIRGRYAPTEIPLSVNLLRVSHLVTLALMIEKVVAPFTDLSNILRNSLEGWDLILKQGIYLSLFFAIILIIYFILSWFATISFSLIVKGRRPIEDAMDGNISNIILFVGIQIALAIAVKTAIPDVMGMLIPYPNLPVFH
jgi:hypothetical protein